MATVREIIRQERRDLGLVVLVGGIAVDWLAAAGCLDRAHRRGGVDGAVRAVPAYRKAVEAGEIRVEELSETALNARLGAGARGLPFLTTRGLIGTDLIDLSDNLRDARRPVRRPAGGRLPRASCPTSPSCTCTAPTASATLSSSRPPSGPTSASCPRPPQRVVVTAEEIVDTDVLRAQPDRTVLPGVRRVRRWSRCPTAPTPRRSTRTTATTPSSTSPGSKAARDPETAPRSSTVTCAGPATRRRTSTASAGASPLIDLVRWERRDATTRLHDRRADDRPPGRLLRGRRPGVNGMASFLPVIAFSRRAAHPRPRPGVARRRRRARRPRRTKVPA